MFAILAILFVMTWGVALFAFHVAGFSIPGCSSLCRRSIRWQSCDQAK